MKLEQHWLELTEGSDQITPSTREATGITLRGWDAFMMKRIVSYYSTLADAFPESTWVDFHIRIKAVKPPKQRASAPRYQTYPLELLPEILDAAKECDERYDNEAYPLVAGFLYSGMRAQMYGIKVSEINFDTRINEPRVKGGHRVKLPMHKQLAKIWKEHMKTRAEQDSPFLFRFGRYPYEYVKDSGDKQVWGSDTKASSRNRDHVRHLLAKVEEGLKERGIEEHLMSHRFRKSVRSYVSQYRHLTNPPMDLKDGQILMSHKAKDITDLYDLRDFRETRDRYDQMDFGSQEWVKFAQNGGRVSVADGEHNGTIKDELRTLINGRALTAQDKLEMMAVIQEA
jgi:site-specific recombinase XerC